MKLPAFTFAVCVFALSALGQVPQASVPAQAGQEGVPVIRVNTRLVNVPVNVTDAHGAAVPNLTRDDFTVWEDGKPQAIALFERESSSPLSIVMAVDTSSSVFTQFRTEKAAAKQFIEEILRPEDEMELIAFSEDSDEIVSYTNDPRRVEQGLGRMQRGDDTALYNAIYVASHRLSEAKPDAERRRVLVLISDGGDNPIKREIGYEKAVAEAQRAGAAIYPIIIMPILADAGRDVGGEHALIQMAEDTGGKYFYVTRKEDLGSAFEHLSDELRTQYLLGYYAPPGGSEGGFRSIKVSLKNADVAGKATVRARTGYYEDAR